MQIFKSRYTPGIKGSEICWEKGEIAQRISNGNLVRIDSDLMTHDNAPCNGLIFEVIYEDGSGRFAVLADDLLPIDHKKNQKEFVETFK